MADKDVSNVLNLTLSSGVGTFSAAPPVRRNPTAPTCISALEHEVADLCYHPNRSVALL